MKIKKGSKILERAEECCYFTRTYFKRFQTNRKTSTAFSSCFRLLRGVIPTLMPRFVLGQNSILLWACGGKSFPCYVKILQKLEIQFMKSVQCELAPGANKQTKVENEADYRRTAANVLCSGCAVSSSKSKFNVAISSSESAFLRVPSKCNTST